MEHYKSKDWEIIASGRRDTSFFETRGVSYAKVDIRNWDDFKALPQDDVHAVIMLAGLLPAYMEGYNPHAYLETNTIGTLNVLEYCRQVRADRVLIMQTLADLYGYIGNTFELAPDLPRKLRFTTDHAVYSISKCASVDLSEHYHQEYGIKNFVFRLPNIYMYTPDSTYYVNGKERPVSYKLMIDRARKGLPIELWGDPDMGKDFPYVKDFCQELCCAIDAKNIDGGLFNVGTGVKVSMREQIEGIVSVFWPEGSEPVIVPRPDMPSCRNFVMNIDNAKKMLGYQPQYDYISYLEDYKMEMNGTRFDGREFRRS